MKIAGVDEVGVGCLEGPLVSAAVIFGKNKSEYFFKDSKKTSQKNREIQAKYIKNAYLVGNYNHRHNQWLHADFGRLVLTRPCYRWGLCICHQYLHRHDP
mgnify:CR=1 FL=1